MVLPGYGSPWQWLVKMIFHSALPLTGKGATGSTPSPPVYFPFPRLRTSASPWNCPSAMALYSPPDDALLDELPLPAPVGVTGWTPSLPRRSKTRSTMASTDMPLGMATSADILLCSPPSRSAARSPSAMLLVGCHPCQGLAGLALYSPSGVLTSAADEPCDPGDLSHTCALAPLPLF